MKTETFTTGIDGYVSLVQGHVEFEKFKEAFYNEGWKPNVVFLKSSVKHQWWVVDGGHWKRSVREVKGAEPVTVLEW